MLHVLPLTPPPMFKNKESLVYNEKKLSKELLGVIRNGVSFEVSFIKYKDEAELNHK